MYIYTRNAQVLILIFLYWARILYMKIHNGKTWTAIENKENYYGILSMYVCFLLNYFSTLEFSTSLDN